MAPTIIEHMNGMELVSVADAAAALDHATQQLQAAEVGQVLAIAAMCDLYRVDEDVMSQGIGDSSVSGHR